MTTFDDQIAAAVSSLFTAGAAGAESALLNSTAVVCQVIEEGHDEEFNSSFDYIDVEFLNTSYAAIDYRDDDLVVRGVTWLYPKMQRKDRNTILVRFRRNVKPIGMK